MKLLPGTVIVFLVILTGVVGQTQCSSGDDCQKNEYCSQGSCRESGTCGKLNDCHNPSNAFPMIECVGFLYCSDDGQCGIECGDSMCPPGEISVQCLMNPCDVDTCDEPHVACSSSYCGGCHSRFFDAAGNEVCTDDDPVGSNDQGKSCSSTDDCQEKEYCSEGLCRDFGTCEQLNDCRNPSNDYPRIECVGFLYCSDDGQCNIECGSFCPPDEEEFECLANPCDVDTCDDDPDALCVSSNCGGCNSHFFNSAGNEVCTEVNQTNKDSKESTGSPGQPSQEETDSPSSPAQQSQEETDSPGSSGTLSYYYLNHSSIWVMAACVLVSLFGIAP